MNNNSQSKANDLSDIRYVKRISIGSINPNVPMNEEQTQKQMDLLNMCLSSTPKGMIIGKEMAVGVFQFGEHQITTQRITYHVGFIRKPYWLQEEE